MRTVLRESAHKFTLQEAEKALEFCESIPQRKGKYKIVPVED